MPVHPETTDELFISVDVATAGPIPPTYSLLSLGACVIGDPSRRFYVELVPLNGNAIPEAIRVCGLTLQHLKEHGEEPANAMSRFAGWVREVSDGRKPVFVGLNACFDWAFANWYLLTFAGGNPCGHGALDIKAYYMGLSRCRWSETTSSRIPARYLPGGEVPTAHNALMDALWQAQTFHNLLRCPRGNGTTP